MAPDEVGSYRIVRTLGLGSQAKVKLAESKLTGQQVAIKIYKKSTLASEPDLNFKVQREIAIMRLFDHPRILKVLEVMESSTHLYIILEYVSQGELHEKLEEEGPVGAALALKFFRQMVDALEFLHLHGICHRDMKPENLLVDENNNIKISDFGFSRWMRQNTTTTPCGSPLCVAPEVFSGRPYNGCSADVWSTGVVFFVLMCGRYPFEDDSVSGLHRKIAQGDFKMPNFPDLIKDLIAKMLTVDPRSRIGVVEIKQHPAYRLLLPADYVFPRPLALPIISEPIDLDRLAPGIVTNLRAIGFQDENELRNELGSAEQTRAKEFVFLMRRKWDFDALPWGQQPGWVSIQDLDESVEESIVFERREIGNITRRYDNLVILIQQYLGECGFEWLYPHDQLIYGRREADGIDLVIEIEYVGYEQLKVVLGLASGDDIGFCQFADMMSRHISAG
jgi:BR serine/threonine kinase